MAGSVEGYQSPQVDSAAKTEAIDTYEQTLNKHVNTYIERRKIGGGVREPRRIKQ